MVIINTKAAYEEQYTDESSQVSTVKEHKWSSNP